MTPEHLKNVEHLFHAALDQPDGRRREWIDIACDDTRLRDEVLSLLAHHEGDALVDAPLHVTTPPTSLFNLIGEVLDQKYRIETQLGKGGMGSVFLATHLGTDRPVALKVIAPELAARPEFLERFRREAKAAGRLRHPNIVNVTDFGIAEPRGKKIAYLAMEYLDGQTLGEFLKTNPRPSVEQVVEILEQTCLAVDEAHNRGIVHRDLKPDNIWLQPDGRGGLNVKVLDFGLAKLEFSDDEPYAESRTSQGVGRVSSANRLPAASLISENTPTLLRPEDTGSLHPAETVGAGLTRRGLLMGTPLYMSPEQCRGERIDAKSDIYSLGVIAHQMLAGETPFSGDFAQLVAKHGHDAPPRLAEKRRDLPREVSDCVMSALAKNPSERPASALAFLSLIRALVGGEDQLAAEADRLVQTGKDAFVSISEWVRAPFFLATGAATLLLTTHWTFDVPLGWVLQPAGWLVPLLLIMAALDAGTTFGLLALEQSNRKTTEPPRVSAILKELIRERRRLFFSLKHFFGNPLRLFRPELLFASSIAAVENRSGADARRRSRVLVKHLRPIASALHMRRLGLASGLVLVGLLFCTVIRRAALPAELRSVVLALAMSALAVGAIKITNAMFSRSELSAALLFLKARQADGDSTSDQPQPVRIPLTRTTTSRQLRRRTVELTARLIAGTLCFGFVFVLLVPPVGSVPHFDPPKVMPIPDADNAWVEYKIALGKLGMTYPNTVNPPLNLWKYVEGTAGVTPELRQYLADNQDVLRHLTTATSRPRAQFTTNVDSLNAPAPEFTSTLTLGQLACAQARLLIDEGRSRDAVPLILATYRLGTDLAEPGADFVTQRASTAVRSSAEQSLLYLLNNGNTDAATDVDLARRLAEMDARLPSPEIVIETEWLNTARLAERFLVTEGKTTNGLDPTIDATVFFPGLRIRTYHGFSRRFPALLETFRPHLKTWNLAGLRQASDNLGRSLRTPSFTPFPGDWCADRLIALFTPYPWAILRTLYHERSRSTMVQTILVCNAHRKRHGDFPERLESAFREVNFPAPIDLATGKPAGYRLEGGVPVVWCAGPDGTNDGGHKAYPKNRDFPVAGNDDVLRFGDREFLN